MFALTKKSEVSHNTKNLNQLNLEELFAEAESYGRIYLHQSGSDGTFSLNIQFETIPGTVLEAKSGFGHKTKESAIIAAIDRAKAIKSQFKE